MVSIGLPAPDVYGF